MSGPRPAAEFARAEESARKYDFEFRVWPVPDSEPALFEVARNMHRQVFTMTTVEFAEFRASLERAGFMVREATCVPHFDPEPV